MADPANGEPLDAYIAVWGTRALIRAPTVAGHGLTIDGNDMLSGGTANYYFEYYSTDGGVSVENPLSISNFSISATEFATAIRSKSTADDIKLASKIFSGNDRFDLSPENDQVTGFTGNDRIRGAEGDDTLSGGPGNDSLYGDDGADRLYMDAGNDVLSGGWGRDTAIVMGKAPTRIDLALSGGQKTGRGIDKLDQIENLRGGQGKDLLFGSSTANALNGQGGNDLLVGRNGHDRLIGGDGNDRLIGGPGSDILRGGTGADRFVFNSISDSKASQTRSDKIIDFQQGQDKIVLSRIDADPLVAGNDRFQFIGDSQIGTDGGGQVAYQQIMQNNKAVTLVLIDNNADAQAESIIALHGRIDLTADDFIL
ncbi:calcium-binding protein [Paracoccus sp. (in: a-proteobacteria)]|uniref:calcium-binding protein n=1 Tax=Paracoccus sp. TaxID=267 RepID=UPI003A87D7EF